MIPLFSIRTQKNWGIGEILDIIPFIDFMAETSLSILQLLPHNEMAPGETSPYSALSAFAFDPIYLSLHAWEDFSKSPKVQKIYQDKKIEQGVETCQNSPTVCYEAIRAFKNNLFQPAFERFKRVEWKNNTRCRPRARAFQSFMEAEADWLEDYALFRYLKTQYGCEADWPTPYRERHPLALSQLKEEAYDALLFIKYLQWACWEQWQAVRRYARDKNILLMGDIPFLVGRDSADVWSRPREFTADTVGVPPDDMNADGQSWGLPMFSLTEMEASGFQWWRQRIRKARAQFDIIRLDHIIGFFRTWVFPQNGAPYFEPAEEEKHIQRGRLFLDLFLEEAGSCMLVAEDLGVIPWFVYEQLNACHVPGIKVLRWQKKDNHYLHPREYPALSLATTGTHDTSSLAFWWNHISHEERFQFITAFNEKDALPSDTCASPFSEAIHQATLRGLMAAESVMAIIPFCDILGQEDQINFPGTVSDKNWRYRMPINVEQIANHPLYKGKIDFIKAAIENSVRQSTAITRLTS
jgi:4-alpha-glucanotransferase